jgi:NTE family protein
MAEPRIGLILGGGGVVGVAWELGVLAALGAHSGWSPATATVITGTSAGSMVGAVTALGQDLDEMVDARSAGATIPDPPPPAPPGTPVATVIPEELLDLLSPANGTAAERGRKIGQLALAAEPIMDPPSYRAMIGAGVGSEEWPDADLRMTTVDCESGETVILHRTSGLDLTSAVAASCAVPTYFPPVEHEGRHYTDGPRAPYIADLVAELDLGAIVFVGPKLAIVEGADEHVELDALESGGLPIARITGGPEFAAVANALMDPQAAGAAALIGRLDGQRAAERVRSTIATAASRRS